MRILGISLQHDSGAAIIQDGRIVSAVNEERLNRIKLFPGLPEQSIKAVMRIASVSPEQIDYIAICNIAPFMNTDPSTIKNGSNQVSGFHNLDLKRKVLNFAFDIGAAQPIFSTHAGIKLYRSFFGFGPFRKWRMRSLYQLLKDLNVYAPIHYVDHHCAHAASAHYTSPWEEATIVTSDASGDGYSSTACICNNGEIKRIREIPMFHSLAYYYAYITQLIGFRANRHEGKVLGLAAYGVQDKRLYDVLSSRIKYNPKSFAFIHKGKFLGGEFNYLKSKIVDIPRENVATTIQQFTENLMTNFVSDAVERTGIGNVSLAGGIFANVKLNQRIAELPEINKVYIHPHMGDGGLAVGAALALWADLMLDEGKKPKPHPIDNVYFGPEYSNDEIEKNLHDSGLRYNYKYHEDIEIEIAQLVADKKIVGRFNGRMEYGPRALGNRSILAYPTDTTINDWLNKRLRRTEFMPFAPSLMREHAEDFFRSFDTGEIAAKFMTITFDVTDEGVKRAPAVVHIDNTARPQTVTREQNESYYKILKAYYEITRLPIFVNTSFNMHEEPIVCSPYDAIRAFKLGSVDVLAIGAYIVKKD